MAFLSLGRDACADCIYNTLSIIWDTFIPESNYRRWLEYHRQVAAETGNWRRFEGGLFCSKNREFLEDKFPSEDPLFTACLFGWKQTFTILFESRPNVEDSLNKLLQCACAWGYSELVQYLLEKGASTTDPEADQFRFLPLYYAARGGH
jgi:hypothetical protein